MPKMLVIAGCLINHGDDRGGVAHAQGEIVEVNKDTADTLAKMDRALYASREDDPTKAGIHTASPDMLKAAQAMAKGKPAE